MVYGIRMHGVARPGEKSIPVQKTGCFGTGRLIKKTRSVCPECLNPVGAGVYERSGQVWLDKRCPEHGSFSALLSRDLRHYYEPADKISAGRSCCGGTMTCGDPLTNHSCTILIEITERCNLTCPTCYAGSSPQHSKMMSRKEFTRQVDQLVANGKAGADMIQLSGGEPTIHPQLFAMIDILAERGFTNVCINTNGIKLASLAFAEKLARGPASIFIYLQFDGFEKATYQALRGRSDLLKVKRKAIENCLQLGLGVHPVMTLTRGINDHEVGAFLNLALAYPEIKNVVIQPAMYSGRYENPQRVDRLTLADTVQLVCSQFGVFAPEDFGPIPCSHPNCLSMAAAMRTDSGLIPISRYLPGFRTWDAEGNRELIGRVTDTINGPLAFSEALRWLTTGNNAGGLFNRLDDAEVDRLLNALLAWEMNGGDKGDIWDALFVVTIKPFMDAYTYDQDRIDRCCVHILDAEGNPVSFCEYNAVHRPRINAAAVQNTSSPPRIKVVLT